MDGCFIPEKIKVGYQEREDTYSGKLAYVIYYDEKNKLRKETSWNSWRQKDILPDDFDNKLIEGFVLNKKTGDYHGDWFSNRQAYIRVFDPRGFEIEITVNNLLYILENCDCIKGKGLSGRFCYGWTGTDLVLIPECSEGYKESRKYTDTLYVNKKIKKSELEVGQVYILRGNKKVLYLGYLNYFRNHRNNEFDGTYYGKKHYYIDVDDLKEWNNKNVYHYFNSSDNFKPIAVDNIEYDYSCIMEELNNQIFCSGKYVCYYDGKELSNLLKSCKEGLYIYKRNDRKEFLKKVSDNTVMVDCSTPYFQNKNVEFTVNDLVNMSYGYYIGNFVNGNLIDREKYAEIV